MNIKCIDKLLNYYYRKPLVQKFKRNQLDKIDSPHGHHNPGYPGKYKTTS